MRTYNFISGLPRSGSTLLSSILKQNPRFTTGISDPLQGFCHSIIKEINSSVGVDSFFNEERTTQILRDLFDSFYSNGNEVCFNTNRGWTADTNLLKTLFPKFKMIVCVRHIPWILDSFEKLHNKNPYTVKPLYHHQTLTNVYQRTHMLMGNMQNFGGYVSGPIDNLKQSIYSQETDQICYVEYGALTNNPQETMERIYDFLGEPWFEHDFNNVEDSYDEFDNKARIEGLHTIRKEVKFISRNSILPIDLWSQYESQSFWLHESFNDTKNNLNWIGANLTPQEPQQKHIINKPVKRQL